MIFIEKKTEVYLIFSPLDQFDIKDLISLYLLNALKLSITNISLYIFIATFFILYLHLISTNYYKLTYNY